MNDTVIVIMLCKVGILQIIFGSMHATIALTPGDGTCKQTYIHLWLTLHVLETK